MRPVFPLLFALFLACPPRVAPAQGNGADLISLGTSHSTLLRLALVLTRATGETYRVDPALEQHRVDLTLAKVPRAQVPDTSVRQLEKIVPGLVVEKQNDGWLFKLRPGAPIPLIRPAPLTLQAGKVTVLFGGVPLRKATAHLFAEAPGVRKPSPYKVEFDADVPDVPIDLQHTANGEDLILEIVMRQAAASERGITLERFGNRFTVGVFLDARPPRGRLFPKLVPLDGPADRRILCAFERFPLVEAAQMVVRSATVPHGPLLQFESADALPTNAQITFQTVTNDPELLLQRFLEAARQQVPGLGFTRTDDKVTLTYRQP